MHSYRLCAIKILAILAFFVIAIVIDVGGVGDQGYLGAKYWHDPGAFADGINGANVCLFRVALVPPADRSFILE